MRTSEAAVALVARQCMASSAEGRPIVHSDSLVMDMPLGHSGVEGKHRIEPNEMASYGARRDH